MRRSTSICRRLATTIRRYQDGLCGPEGSEQARRPHYLPGDVEVASTEVAAEPRRSGALTRPVPQTGSRPRLWPATCASGAPRTTFLPYWRPNRSLNCCFRRGLRPKQPLLPSTRLDASNVESARRNHVSGRSRRPRRGDQPCPMQTRRRSRPVRPADPRRPLSSVVLHAPQVLRAMVRADEIWLVVLAAFLGCGTGIAVWVMTAATQYVHEALFGIAHDQRLSAMDFAQSATARCWSPPSAACCSAW